MAAVPGRGAAPARVVARAETETVADAFPEVFVFQRGCLRHGEVLVLARREELEVVRFRERGERWFGGRGLVQARRQHTFDTWAVGDVQWRRQWGLVFCCVVVVGVCGCCCGVWCWCVLVLFAAERL